MRRAGLVRALRPTGAGVDLLVYRGLVAAHVPVGWCDRCGGPAYGGADARPVRAGSPRWAFPLRCEGCGAESVYLDQLAADANEPAAPAARQTSTSGRRRRRAVQLALPIAG